MDDYMLFPVNIQDLLAYTWKGWLLPPEKVYLYFFTSIILKKGKILYVY